MTRKALIAKIYLANADSGNYNEYVTELDEENAVLALKCIDNDSEIAIGFQDLQELNQFVRDQTIRIDEHDQRNVSVLPHRPR